MAAWKLPAEVTSWIAEMARRCMPAWQRGCCRCWWACSSPGPADGRQLAAGGATRPDFRLYYYFLGSLGRKVEWVAAVLLRLRRGRRRAGRERLLFALDDTPTKRYGPQVEGAGIHHNPTPGPAEQKFLYGHVWVTLAWVVRHPLWGTIGLPLLRLLYVRQADCAQLPARLGVAFRTKLEMAVELVAWAGPTVAWAKRCGWWPTAPMPSGRSSQAAGRGRGGGQSAAQGCAAVERAADAASRRAKKAGRPRIYGKERISLAKRAGHRQGWQTATFVLYGEAGQAPTRRSWRRTGRSAV